MKGLNHSYIKVPYVLEELVVLEYEAWEVRDEEPPIESIPSSLEKPMSASPLRLSSRPLSSIFRLSSRPALSSTRRLSSRPLFSSRPLLFSRRRLLESNKSCKMDDAAVDAFKVVKYL